MRQTPPRIHLAVYLFYLLVAIGVTWPLVTVFATRLAGHPTGDAYEMIRHIWWFKHALQTEQSLFEHPLLVYPEGTPGWFLWGVPLQSFPAWLFAFVMPLPAAYNTMILLRLALNGWAMYLLVHYLTGGRAMPAVLAGLVFMLYPAFQGQLGASHVGILALWPVPLFARSLFRLRDGAGWQAAVAAAVFFALSLMGSLNNAVVLLLPFTALFMLALMSRRRWTMLRRTLIAVLLGAALALPLVVPAALEILNAPPQVRDERGVVRYSADLLAIAAPSFYHPLFGGWEYNRRVLGIDPFEGAGYIGMFASALALFALWRNRLTRWWGGLALVAWVLSLGPLLKVASEPLTLNIDGYATFVTLPWAALHDLPLLSITRTPARFNFTVGLALAVMAGYGANAILIQRKYEEGNHRGKRARYVLLVVLMALIAFEYQWFWREDGRRVPELPTVPGVVPEAVAALREREDVRAVFNIPWEHLLAAKEGMFLQTAHQKPMLGGQITRRTPADPAKLTMLQTALDPALLLEAGADVVILHKTWDDEAGVLEARARERLGEPTYEDALYAVFDVPQTDDTPAFFATSLGEAEARAVGERAEFYLYAPEHGWADVTLRGEGSADNVVLSLDGQQVLSPFMESAVRLSLPLTPGYHMLALSRVPPCPVAPAPALTCPTFEVTGLDAAFAPQPPPNAVVFGGRVTLAARRADVSGDKLEVTLQWQVDAPLIENDIRFVHVLNAAGELVAQTDGTLGAWTGGARLLDTAQVDLPDNLPSGEYSVYAGWYTYPDLTRFPVTGDTPRAADGLGLVATVDVQAQGS